MDVEGEPVETVVLDEEPFEGNLLAEEDELDPLAEPIAPLPEED